MTATVAELLNPIDVAELSVAFQAARPTRFFAIDAFLRPAFAKEVIAAYPSYADAQARGHQFMALNEKRKVQVTDVEAFPEPVKRLHEVLASEMFVGLLSRITGLERLEADPQLGGGGMHVMASGGRLDVHVDFNLIRDRALYRRLNLLVFLNERWEDAWGGHFELWDPDVKKCLYDAAPVANRCVVFNTTETSFHGVRPIRAPEGVTRNSFAAYYYTRTPPLGTDGSFHSTIFRPRPNEWLRGHLGTTVEKLVRRLGRVRRSIFRKDESPRADR